MRQLKIQKAITSRNNEALDRYLTEIAREPLLTPEEEAELAAKVHAGGKEGEKARDKLVRSNLRFVVSVAKQYQHQGISLTDLIDEGNMGLVKAAEKFDETRGFKFISYAVWWIRQSIMEALAVKSRIIRVPLNQTGMALKVNRAQEEFMQKNGRMPSVHELSVVTGLDEETIEAARDVNHHTTSIDAPLGTDDDSDNTIGDMLSSDDNAFKSDSNVDQESMRTFIEDLLKEVLNEREQHIVKESFGLGCVEKSLEEIADEMGMTRERIRQVREKAIRKIKHSPAAKMLKQYL
jgi:RNA polymerase primary sigma factor